MGCRSLQLTSRKGGLQVTPEGAASQAEPMAHGPSVHQVSLGPVRKVKARLTHIRMERPP